MVLWGQQVIFVDLVQVLDSIVWIEYGYQVMWLGCVVLVLVDVEVVGLFSIEVDSWVFSQVGCQWQQQCVYVCFVICFDYCLQLVQGDYYWFMEWFDLELMQCVDVGIIVQCFVQVVCQVVDVGVGVIGYVQLQLFWLLFEYFDGVYLDFVFWGFDGFVVVGFYI